MPSTTRVTGCNTPTCVDSTFEFTLSAGGTSIHSALVNVADDIPGFVGFLSSQPFDGVAIREHVGSNDNEYFGEMFVGDSPLSGGSNLTLVLSDAHASSTTALVAGFSVLNAPFKGGVLVPNPFAILAGLPVSASGDLALAFSWPAGVPSGFTILFQHWITDPAGPVGFAASNGVRGTTP